MNRRDLLKIAGLQAFSFAGLSALPKFAFADGESYAYDGPLFLSIHAGGGWDPTSFCDPKGRLNEQSPDPVNHYFIDQIRSPSVSSPIKWAPMGQNEAFFQAHYDKMLVINGVDTYTNNHSTGTRYVNSGELNEGHPAFAAMLAAVKGPNLPMAFITNGGYDVTRGITPRSRLGQLGIVAKIAEPNKDGERFYHPETVLSQLEAFRQSRVDQKIATQGLPRLQDSLNKIAESRSGRNELKRLTQNLPNLNQFRTSIGQQGAIALAGYRSGVTISATLSEGGFDTHGQHDTNQSNALNRLTAGVMELWTEIERQGMEDRVLIMISSDFGRTPRYNEGNGKDHWPITSVIFMGAGIQGNRVIGGSDDQFRALSYNLDTLERDENGVHIEPKHIHQALRQHFGIDQQPVSASYPLTAPALNAIFAGV